MRRGSTPTNVFHLPIDLSQATVFVSYEQHKRVIVEKTGSDLTFAGTTGNYTITVELTQQDTLKFRDGNVNIQIRYVFPTGDADASNIVTTTAERILKDGVISAV
jgi:hypothetical protein